VQNVISMSVEYSACVKVGSVLRIASLQDGSPETALRCAALCCAPRVVVQMQATAKECFRNSLGIIPILVAIPRERLSPRLSSCGCDIALVSAGVSTVGTLLHCYTSA
jgi:hypothetical protein